MKSFAEACRMYEPLQLLVEATGEQDSGVRVLHQPFALVGRDRLADVPLEHRLISRRHAYLQVVDGRVFWIDLDSRLGISSDGRARKCGWLTAYEPMRIGPYEIRRRDARGGPERDDGLDLDPLTAKSYGSGPWPEAALEFLNGPSRSAVWPMNRVVSLVGSSSSCKFRLADPSVSPFHGSLVRTPMGVWVVDLLGGAGIAVNNGPVRYALLNEGDVLEIGRYRIRIRSGQPPARARAALEGRTAPSPMLASPYAGQNYASDRDGLRAELMPQSALTPTIVEESKISESVLVPLVNQFGMMQQQMMDQFQNAMVMLVDMFGTLQREQMDLIRQELDQLREVTKEFQELKGELAELSRARRESSVAAVSDAPSAPPIPDLPSAAPAVIAQPSTPGPLFTPAPEAPATSASGKPSISPPILPPLPPKRRVQVDPKPSVKPENASPAPEVARLYPTIEAPQPNLAPAPAEPPAPDRVEAGAKPSPGPRPGKKPAERPAGNDADVMLWLNQRISTLQNERETRWQKILKLLPGGGS